MIKKSLLLAVALALTCAARLSAQTGLNGTDARPFYIVAHNPNTLEMAELALLNHANALEPDIMVLPPGALAPGLVPVPDGMVMYHDNVLTPNRVPLTLEEYLDGVHLLAKKYQHLALIIFDVKPQAAHAVNGPKILQAVKDHLNKDGVNLNVIISVGNRVPDGDLFTDIYSKLGEREGVQVDAEDRADDVVAFLQKAAFGNIGYGDGTLGPGPNLPRAVDLASFLKASWGFPRVISNVYTISLEDSMHFFIDAGADGIIPDHFPFIPPLPGLGIAEFDPLSVGYTTLLWEVLKNHPEMRLATRDDNPFKPKNQAYGLKVRTMDVQDAGTNADLTFTLNGCRGSSTVTYNSGFVTGLYSTGRMEKGETDFVTIPSLNLGKLTSIAIHNDGTGLGPDWDLQDVAVSSARWLAPNFFGSHEYRATYNGTVPADSTLPLNLTPNFQEPLPTIQCPAPITVNNAPGLCNAVVAFAPKVDGMCPDVTAVSLPPSGSAFNVGTTNVSSKAKSAEGESPACSFTVTVKDAEGPVIACPGPMTVAATSPLGAAVTFAPVAGDNCSASVTSAPTSGSVFAIGTTTVNSTAQDPSGNQASCSFTVHVKGPVEQTNDLIAAVNSLTMKDGVKNGLLVKLDLALAKLLTNNTPPACGALADFIDLVNAQRGKVITLADADALIAQAKQIRAVIGC